MQAVDEWKFRSGQRESLDQCTIAKFQVSIHVDLIMAILVEGVQESVDIFLGREMGFIFMKFERLAAHINGQRSVFVVKKTTRTIFSSDLGVFSQCMIRFCPQLLKT